MDLNFAFWLSLVLAAMGCFAMGWWARDVKQKRLEADEFYERYDRPCEHIDPEYGACTATGQHTFHTRGSVSWSKGWG